MIERFAQVITRAHAPDVQPLTATAGAAAGWLSTASFVGAAQLLAALATASWMIAQTWVLLKNQRCTRHNCPNRSQ